jgi:hypothetical protein
VDDGRRGTASDELDLDAMSGLSEGRCSSWDDVAWGVSVWDWSPMDALPGLSEAILLLSVESGGSLSAGVKGGDCIGDTP